ncbi:MAG: hypothetical protein AAB655_01275 [Patescibacteria group bacterium]
MNGSNFFRILGLLCITLGLVALAQVKQVKDPAVETDEERMINFSGDLPPSEDLCLAA